MELNPTHAISPPSTWILQLYTQSPKVCATIMPPAAPRVLHPEPQIAQARAVPHPALAQDDAQAIGL